MVRSQIMLLIAGAASAFAAPHLAMRDDKVSDTQVLQFALMLEQLENAFYDQALGQFDEQAFIDAGFPSWVRGRFEQIRGHEQTHVDFLTTALGDQAPQPCTYDFPYNDPVSFAALSMALETVGASAYLGAAHLLQNPDTLTEAASILAVESRQAAWVGSAVLKGSAWDGPFETPLSIDGVFSLASQFIVSCPDSNPKLPIDQLPRLTIDPASPLPGQSVTFKFKHNTVNPNNVPLFVAWFDGIELQYSDLSGDNKATVPDGLQGTVYAAIVKDKADKPTEQVLLTGLVMFEIGFSSFDSNP